MAFDPTQPHIFTKNFTCANPFGGGGCFSYEAGMRMSMADRLALISCIDTMYENASELAEARNRQ